MIHIDDVSINYSLTLALRGVIARFLSWRKLTVAVISGASCWCLIVEDHFLRPTAGEFTPLAAMEKQLQQLGQDSPAVLVIGKLELRFEEEKPEDEFAERAERELRETPETRLAGVEALRELVRADTELNFPLEDESRLLIFLRPCKFYPESAYQLLRRYYQFRLKNPKVYADLTPRHERNLFEQNIMSVLPRRDKLGRRVMVVEAGSKWLPSKVKLDEIFRGCALFLEGAMGEPRTQVSGVVVIIDQAGLSLNHVMQFTPAFASAVVKWVQECLPVRLKGVHIINQPYIFNMIFAIFKPFLAEKLRKRIHFHGTDRKSLLKYVDAETLPERYGGCLDLPEVTSQQWYELMLMRNHNYELLNTFGYGKV